MKRTNLDKLNDSIFNIIDTSAEAVLRMLKIFDKENKYTLVIAPLPNTYNQDLIKEVYWLTDHEEYGLLVERPNIIRDEIEESNDNNRLHINIDITISVLD